MLRVLCTQDIQLWVNTKAEVHAQTLNSKALALNCWLKGEGRREDFLPAESHPLTEGEFGARTVREGFALSRAGHRRIPLAEGRGLHFRQGSGVRRKTQGEVDSGGSHRGCRLPHPPPARLSTAPGGRKGQGDTSFWKGWMLKEVM